MIEIGNNDDYSILNTKEYDFYFGYEYVRLSNGKYRAHTAIKDKEQSLDYEWCFTVTDKKLKKIIYKKPVSKLAGDSFECYDNLLYGIGLFLNKEYEKNKKPTSVEIYS